MKGLFTSVGFGLSFTILWASASVATKIALQEAQPLVIAEVRFGIAAAILLLLAHGVLRRRLPQGKEWTQIFIYGLLNVTIYLGLYVTALQYITAGIAALAIAANPVLISFLSLVFLGQRLTVTLLLSLLICSGGVLCAAWPLLHTAVITPTGLWLILVSMVCYSAGALYFSAKRWDGLDLLTINGWQTLIGGLCLLPVALFKFNHAGNNPGTRFWCSVLWLAIPVSIVAMQLWMRLLKLNAVKAALWLFLCPLFGFILSGWLLKEPITAYTVAGMLLVVAGVALARAGRIPAAQKSEAVPVPD